MEASAILVLAGAGSGKTRTLIARAQILMARGVRSDNICAMTFTNKAAREMKNRIGQGRFPFFGTFHGIAAQILRREHEAAGLSNNFRILDDSDQQSLMKRVVKENRIDLGKITPRTVLGKISQAKNELTSMEDLADGLPSWQNQIAEAILAYDKAMQKTDGLDFDDILIRTVELFSNNAEILAKWQNRFEHILVDEYQDTNLAQYRLVKLLAGDISQGRSLCVVGDDWQSIYSWRGADFRNILRFEKDFPNARVVKLQKNYRSTQKILDAADRVIKSSHERSEKIMNATREIGEDVKIVDCTNEKDEAWFVARHLTRPLRDCAVLFRTNVQSLPFEQVLSELGIKYKVYGGQKFFDRKEIKDILAYARLVMGGLDYPALARAISTPSRGIGVVSMEKFVNFAREDYVESMLDIAGSDLGAKMKNAFQDLGQKLAEIRMAVEAGISPAEVLKRLTETTGYWEYLDENIDPEGSRRANLEALIAEAADFENLNDFLAAATLSSSADEEADGDAVVLSTIHAAKGLEFETVFVVGLEEGLLPFARAMESSENLEEEIRLTYVAMTRARENLYLLWARQRTVFGQRKYQERSRFLDLVENGSNSSRSRTDGFNPPTDSSDSELVYEAVDDDYGF